MAGTEELKRMAQYLRDQMVSYGISAEVAEFDALVGFTGTAELMVLEPEKRILQCRPRRDSGRTDLRGLRGHR